MPQVWLHKHPIMKLAEFDINSIQRTNRIATTCALLSFDRKSTQFEITTIQIENKKGDYNSTRIENALYLIRISLLDYTYCLYYYDEYSYRYSELLFVYLL